MAENVAELLYEDICKNPEDWYTRSVLADYFTDHNQCDEGDCLRWMAKAKKRPYTSGADTVAWFDAGRVAPGLGDNESDLPSEVFKHLQGGTATANHIKYESVMAAEKAALDALLKARKEGWNG